MKKLPGFIPIPIIAAIAALVVTASATIFGQITQEGRPLEFVGQSTPQGLSDNQNCQDGKVTASLNWGQIPEASGYRLWEWTGADWRFLATVSLSSNTTWDWQGLTPGGIAYTWGVTAFNADGESAQSFKQLITIACETTGTTPPTDEPTQPTQPTQPDQPSQPVQPTTPVGGPAVPSTPGGLAVIQQCGNGQISATLSWNLVPEANGYRLWEQVDGNWQFLTTLSLSQTTSWDWQGLTGGTSHTWGVTAFNAAGESTRAIHQFITEICVVTGNPPVGKPGINNPPGTVTIAGLTAGTVGQTLTYSLRATDPDGDSIIYRACWDANGDGTIDQTDCRETGQVRSSTEGVINAAWPTAGTFLLSVIAFDGKEYGEWAWATVTISSTGGIVPTPTPTPVGGVVPTPTPQPSPTLPPAGGIATPPGDFRLNSPDNGTTNFTNNPSFSWTQATGANHYWIYLGQPGQGWYWTKKTPTNNAYWDNGNDWQTCPGCPAKDKPQTLPPGQWSWWVAAENTADATWADINQGSFTFTVGPAGGIPQPSPVTTPAPTPTPLPSPGPEATPGARLKPDLAIDLVTVIPPTPRPDEQVAVVATIKNKGGAPAKNFKTALVGPDAKTCAELSVFTGELIDELPAGAIKQVTFRVTAPSRPFETWTAPVYTDSTCAVDELDETNNSQYVTFKTSEHGPTVGGIPYSTPTYATPTGGTTPTSSPTTNRPPNTPAKPQGPPHGIGRVGLPVPFSTSTTDPDKDPIDYYYINISDGRQFSYTASSQESFSFGITWLEPGVHSVRVKAFDSRGAESDWSEPTAVNISGTVAASCITVRNSGDPAKKWDLTFVPVNYSEDQLSKFANDVEQQFNGLLSYQPFSQKSSAINLHRVDHLADIGLNPSYISPEERTNYHKIATSVCPTDIAIVLNNGGGKGSPATSWGDTAGIIIGSLHDKPVIAHEMGHKLGGLAHEGLPATPTLAAASDRPAPNCSPSADSPPWKGMPGTQIGLAGCDNRSNWYSPTYTSIMSANGLFNYNLSHRPDAFDPWNIKLLSDKLAAYEGSAGTGASVTAPPAFEQPRCTGTPILSFNKTTIFSEIEIVTATVSGLSGCDGKTAQVSLSIIADPRISGSCTVAGSGCQTDINSVHVGLLPFQAFVDKNGDYRFSAADGEFSDVVYLTVRPSPGYYVTPYFTPSVRSDE